MFYVLVILLVLLKRNKKKNQKLAISLFGCFLYCGTLSVSKLLKKENFNFSVIHKVGDVGISGIFVFWFYCLILTLTLSVLLIHE